MNRSFTRFHGTDIIEQGMKDVDWKTVRSERDRALAACDWRALKDVVLPTAWKEYRQALRDLPQNFESANDAADSFPTRPPE